MIKYYCYFNNTDKPDSFELEVNQFPDNTAHIIICPYVSLYNRYLRRLSKKGFTISNVTLGVGSFSMMCLEQYDNEGDVHYNPYTRDTFSIAVKATYAEDERGNPIMIYKQPKECSWKKSHKGCCIVNKDGNNYIDGCTFEQALRTNNLLKTVFIDGHMIEEYTLDEVRENLYGGNF